MTGQELKEAMLSERFVTFEGRLYKVSALIYRKGKSGKIVLTAELRDLKADSVCIVNPQKIQEVENGY
ncbi:MAG: hypothetical protein MSA01_06270 [Anaeromassilibacillus sp.]|nr:hypothetical protein [Anaeromassilibacillus sp.]MDY3780535.1 hypothetical protein [Candidatus Limousia pullorum]